MPTIRLLLYPLYICTDDFSLMITFVIDHLLIYCLILHTHGFKARFQQQEERLDDQKGAQSEAIASTWRICSRCVDPKCYEDGTSRNVK